MNGKTVNLLGNYLADTYALQEAFIALGPEGGTILIDRDYTVRPNYEYRGSGDIAFCEPKHTGKVKIVSANGTPYKLMFPDGLIYRLGGEVEFENITFHALPGATGVLCALFNQLTLGAGCSVSEGFALKVVGGFYYFRDIDTPNIPYDQDPYLRVINRANVIPDSHNYSPEVETVGNTRFLMQPPAAKALARMMEDMEKVGLTDREIIQTLRSHDVQMGLLEHFTGINMNKYGLPLESAIKRTVQSCGYPDTSEHRTGLAADIHSRRIHHHDFYTLPEYDWMIEHGAEYGYILRYPKEKIEVTGCVYEPWHFRYVGVENAHEMKRMDYCLEEYAAHKAGLFARDTCIVLKNDFPFDIEGGCMYCDHLAFSGKVNVITETSA